MADKVLLDASILIALYYEPDSQHNEAIAFFEKHSNY